mgnify:CR=1 FL=1
MKEGQEKHHDLNSKKCETKIKVMDCYVTKRSDTINFSMVLEGKES